MKKQLSFVAFSLFGLYSTNIFSQWSANPTLNTSVCVATKNQQNLGMVTDGKGGAIIAWEDSRSSTSSQTDIYIQRIDKDGMTKWTLGGVTICNDPNDQGAIDLVADESGGAI